MISVVSEKNVKNNEIIYRDCLNSLLAEDTANIYEVIRVIDRKPIFLGEHFQRMEKSIQLSGYSEKIDFGSFKSSIELLINENDFENCNVRVSFFVKDEPVILMYFVKSSYPAEELFKTGINVVTIKKQRKNPNVKFFESGFREYIDHVIAEKNAFEAILVNEDSTISEGSRSNIFFVKGNTLVTSPDGTVLLGVTRGKVIEVCENNGIAVEKRNVYLHELKSFDGAFITGTSNNVLPVRAIDENIYDSANNKTVLRASNLYLEEMMKEYK